MKNKKLFCVVSLVLAVMVFASAISAFTAFADDNDTEIIRDYKLGDVNLDGKLNIRDATKIQKFIAKLESFVVLQNNVADYDSDGKINIKDATRIQMFIAGLIKMSPNATVPATIGTVDREPVKLPFVPAP